MSQLKSSLVNKSHGHARSVFEGLSSKRFAMLVFIAPSFLGKDLLPVFPAGFGERIPRPYFASLVVISPLQSIIRDQAAEVTLWECQ